ncbi:MAG: arginine--tRNA ligase, partial [Clostridiales bacterium]|nr:arginine--tRNA ligase [Clostridiales bacterium]
RQDSENPVYYVQYAHARICSLISMLEEEGHPVPAEGLTDASLLSTEQERELIKQLAMFTEEIRMAARDYDPSRINRYVTELAARFHRFYNNCRIRDAEPDLRDARLILCDCTRRVIANSLAIIGVTAPEKM